MDGHCPGKDRSHLVRVGDRGGPPLSWEGQISFSPGGGPGWTATVLGRTDLIWSGWGTGVDRHCPGKDRSHLVWVGDRGGPPLSWEGQISLSLGGGPGWTATVLGRTDLI